MAKKPFLGATILLPSESNPNPREEFFFKQFTENEHFSYTMIDDLMKNKITKESLIFDTMGVKKEDEKLAYAIFSKVIDTLMHRFGADDLTEEFILKDTMSIVRLFDTDVKMNNFIAYMLEHVCEKRCSDLVSMFPERNSLCMDYFWFLQVLENFIVDIYHGERAFVRRYIVREFFNHNNAFFLIIGVFKLEYSLMSMYVSSLAYLGNGDGFGTKKEYIKYYVPAIYENENGEKIYVRQIEFSKIQLEKRAINKDKKYEKSRLNSVLWMRFLDVVSKSNIKQIAYNKKANEHMTVLKEEGKSVKWLTEFKKHI